VSSIIVPSIQWVSLGNNAPLGIRSTKSYLSCNPRAFGRSLAGTISIGRFRGENARPAFVSAYGVMPMARSRVIRCLPPLIGETGWDQCATKVALCGVKCLDVLKKFTEVKIMGCTSKQNEKISDATCKIY
jgi:hypothetical protein